MKIRTAIRATVVEGLGLLTFVLLVGMSLPNLGLTVLENVSKTEDVVVNKPSLDNSSVDEIQEMANPALGNESESMRALNRYTQITTENSSRPTPAYLSGNGSVLGKLLPNQFQQRTQSRSPRDARPPIFDQIVRRRVPAGNANAAGGNLGNRTGPTNQVATHNSMQNQQGAPSVRPQFVRPAIYQRGW